MREFLKGLDLDNELIDTIMVEHGKRLTGLKEQNEELKNANEKLKDDNQELNDKIAENNKSLENLQAMTSENKDLKAQIEMSDSNVKKEFMKFVSNEVYAKMGDDTDFATALSDYKKENPQYFGDTVIKKVQSSPILNGGQPQPQTTNDIMNDILRGSSKN